MKLQTLIVDDTITYRKILSEICGEFEDLQIIGTAPSGSIALRKLEQTHVDLVFLDVFMPEMDGVEVLSKIKERYPETSVVMISGISTHNADSTIKALQLGAVDFIRKPDGPDLNHNFEVLRNDIRSVLRLVKLHTITKSIRQQEKTPHFSPTIAAPIVKPNTLTLPSRISVCVIGVSTGGPEALGKLVPLLSGNLPIPVLIVQHMPPMFTKSLAESLGRKSKILVTEAQEQEQVLPGHVYIAPGGHHMVVRQGPDSIIRIGINDEPPENSCRPSVDVLFRSVASVYGDKGVLSVILTGMGSDGLNGVRTLKRKGCFSITQSEHTCVVYGMPRAIDEAQLSDSSLPLDKIAESVDLIVRKGNSF